MSRLSGSRQLRWLSGYLLVLALGCLVAGIVGLSSGRPGMAITGLPLFALMLLVSRLVSPSHVPSGDDRLVAAQERFFRRLGVRWLSGPDANGPSTGPKDP